jgi:Fic family protein
MSYKLKFLPPHVGFDTKRILKQLAQSHKMLAELKGYSQTIPNQHMLINAVTVNEAKDSSAVENIITTHDELFQAMSLSPHASPAAKEVVSYRTALWHGYELVKAKGMLTTNMIIEIQQLIEHNSAGVRKLSGTVILNETTGEVLHTPPSGESEILNLMANLEKYVNEDLDNTDPLIKLAVLHYQFEAIHPFYDGNGRTGRIINVLYLVLKDLLESPILYLSKHIIRHKAAYYKLLQDVRTGNAWEEWVLFMLAGIEETAEETLLLVKKINALVVDTAEDIRRALPKLYSRELVDALFFDFYTKRVYVEKKLDINRNTASAYLSALAEAGFLSSQMVGKERIYLNNRLFRAVQAAGLP